MPIYMLNKTIVRTHLTSNVTIQATIQSFLVVDWKNNERYWKVVVRYVNLFNNNVHILKEKTKKVMIFHD